MTFGKTVLATIVGIVVLAVIAVALTLTIERTTTGGGGTIKISTVTTSP